MAKEKRHSIFFCGTTNGTRRSTIEVRAVQKALPAGRLADELVTESARAQS